MESSPHNLKMNFQRHLNQLIDSLSLHYVLFLLGNKKTILSRFASTEYAKDGQL